MWTTQAALVLLSGFLHVISAQDEAEPNIERQVDDPDTGRTMRGLVESKGYELEEHSVVTSDQVVIQLHRIPYARNSGPSSEPNKKVVFLAAPLFCSSSFYIDDFPNNTVAFIFADSGYDVWLGNTRGTPYGIRTTDGQVHDEKDRQFFDYTLIDHGVLDIKSQIDYILERTGSQSLSFFGHSQAAASGFALLSKLPEYNSRISAFASLGGFRTFGCNFKDPALNTVWRSMKSFAKSVQFFSAEFNWELMKQMCYNIWGACKSLLAKVIYGPASMSNHTRIPIYLEHYPHSSSIKNLLYYIQMQNNACRNDEHVYEFDYDDEDIITSPTSPNARTNEGTYGSRRPPALPVENIRVPVKVYYSEGDTLIPPSNQRKLIESLPNVVGEYYIASKDFVHGNFAHSPFNMTHIHDTIAFFDSYDSNAQAKPAPVNVIVGGSGSGNEAPTSCADCTIILTRSNSTQNSSSHKPPE
ncbi:lipase 3 [Galendromus occidentalis]|uniref:Lipase 3 n=1 Tax=Galendromus occidentalis TaxID=34638 RepID=A0AAJ6QM62_9ACAR|nr:lipase 3 [Galendromus occidentalis]